MNSTLDQARISLIKTIERMGFPTEFGVVLADELKTEKQIDKMTSYLIQFKPTSMEEIADELVAIKETFNRFKEKKTAEYYNGKINELINIGLPDNDKE